MSAILFQLGEDLVNISAVRQFDDDLEFFALDVWWIVILAEEDSDIVLENIGSLL